MIYGLRCEGELRYIGQTVGDPADRLSGHRCAARKGDDSAVYRWMRRVGPDVVTIDVMATVPVDQLTATEAWMIAAAVKAGFDLANTQFHPLAPALGRTRRGETHPRAKFTDDQVVECRRLYWGWKATTAELAARFGVSRAVMHTALTGRTYGHLPVPERPAVRPCTLATCDRPATKGSRYCGAHAARKQRHGSVDAPVRRRRDDDGVCAAGHPLTEDNRHYGKPRADGTRSYTCYRCDFPDKERGRPGRKRKTECPGGHPLTEDNRVYGRTGPDGERYYACKQCAYERSNASRRARRAAA